MPDARFWMVGVDNESRQIAVEVREQAAEIPNLDLLEPRPHAETMALVERSIGVVSTSRLEGMPNIFLEAWSRGVPVLSLSFDPDGVIESQRLGTFANGDWERFAAAARELAAGGGDRPGVAARGPAYVGRRTRRTPSAGRWQALIEELAAPESPPDRELDKRLVRLHGERARITSEGEGRRVRPRGKGADAGPGGGRNEGWNFVRHELAFTRKRLLRTACLLLVGGTSLAAFSSATPAAEPTIAADPAGYPVIVAAGDIAGPWVEDDATAALLDGIAPGMVLALGDLAYHDGTDAEFAEYYDPTWGRYKAITKPIPGNHEYHMPGASGYFNYFGAAAGEPGKGWYAFDVGGWRIYALNANCDDVGCRAGSEQEQWLRADLAANPRTCTLAMSHTPRFSSHEDDSRRDHRAAAALYQAFYEASGDIWLAGHNHFYERLALLDPSGNADPERGIRTLTVGTGGATLRDLGLPHPGSEVREGDTHGVMRLGLHDAGYEWEFVPVAGKTFTDSGAENCDTAAPAAPTDLKAVATGPTGVDLTWTAATDDAAVTGYDVFRDGVHLATTGAVTGYSDANADPATTYEYWVVARDAAGNVSPPSVGSTATTDPPPARRAFGPEATRASSRALRTTTSAPGRCARTAAATRPWRATCGSRRRA